jgi:hypothetical protein
MESAPAFENILISKRKYRAIDQPGGAWLMIPWPPQLETGVSLAPSRERLPTEQERQVAIGMVQQACGSLGLQVVHVVVRNAKRQSEERTGNYYRQHLAVLMVSNECATKPVSKKHRAEWIWHEPTADHRNEAVQVFGVATRDEWIIGEAMTPSGNWNGYIIHAHAPRFIARVVETNRHGVALAAEMPTNVTAGATYFCEGQVLCEVQWIDDTPATAQKAWLRQAYDALTALQQHTGLDDVEDSAGRQIGSAGGCNSHPSPAMHQAS